MRIAPHFSLAELSKTNTDLPNTPSPLAVDNLKRLALDVLEPIRDLLGCRLVVHSAYRSKEVNRAVGGAKASAHLEGRAADFIPETNEPIRLAFNKIVKSDIPFDKIIIEEKQGKYWIHVQIAHYQDKPRRQALECIVSDSGMQYKEVKK
jgi:zinc D-Ala-D-Ala carboxypeptidase